MKNLFLFLFSIISILGISQSTCINISGDFQQSVSIPVGGATIFDLFFSETSGEQVPVGEVSLTISFPGNGVYINTSLTPFGDPIKSKFNWQWSATDKTMTGVNNAIIEGYEGGNISFNILGVIMSNNIPEETNALASYAFNENGCNDFETSDLIVTTALPIKLSSFNGESKNCDFIHLNWSTSTEVNNDYMEILRSNDGKQFVSIGKVKGTNSIFGDSYSFDDKTDLEPGKNYYYRIKQVDLDGKINLHNVILVRYYCKNMIPEMAVFPNPASELINVSFSGLEKDQKTDLVITNKLGMVVKKLNVDTEDVSEIQISDLPSGIYKIQTTDFDDNLDYRFIHIK